MASEQDLIVGIDVGGTTVKVALVTLEGEVLATEAVRTEHMQTPEEVERAAFAIKQIVDAAAEGTGVVRAVGLAVPGVVSPDDQLLLSPNITLDLPALADKLREIMGVGVYPVNDANAAALGELWQGAGDGSTGLVFVTLGTGVGGGVVEDGRVLVGRTGGAGEIGHITMVKGGRQCGCGRKGCLETYTSARGLVWNYQEACERAGVEGVALEHGAHALPIFDAMRAGDPVAAEAVNELADILADALSTIAATVDPGAFVIGGGMSAAFDLFGERLRTTYRELALPSCAGTPIVEAQLGNLAGMVGAAHHAATRARLL